MLEHLYGLLEPEEIRELNSYLASPEGAGLRAEAEVWRKQLSGAAKSAFPSVRFVPPATTITPARPATTTIKEIWTRWAVAASLMLVLGGLVGPAAYQLFGWYAQSRETSDLKIALNDRRAELGKAEEQQKAQRDEYRQRHDEAVAAHKAAEKAYEAALDGAREAIDRQEIHVRLTGPARALPGAPNEWLIEALTRKGTLAAPKRLELVVRDDRDAVLLRESRAGTQGKTKLELPTSFWASVRPGTDLFLEVAAVADDDRRSVLAKRVPLAGPVLATHLVTDRPLYQPGETVRFRSLTLDRSTFLPPSRDLHLQFRLKDPEGALIPLDEGNGRLLHRFEPVIGPDDKPVRGIGTGEYDLPDDSPAGEYTLEVVEISDREPNEIVLDTRKFLVRKYVAEKLQKWLEFGGKSYGAGDVVQARLEATRIDGTRWINPVADIEVRVGDGPAMLVKKGVQLESAGGDAATATNNLRFTLPADLLARRNVDGDSPGPILVVTIQDGQLRESIQRTIPLVVKELEVEFYPEGGDLVEGVPGRVYFQVRTTGGKAADLSGIITDGQNTIVNVQTVTDPDNPGVNRGQGVFNFTPHAGKKYFLRLRTPAGIAEPTKEGFPLPVAKADGVVLTALDVATDVGLPIRVQVQSPHGPRTLIVGAYSRGHLIGHQRIEVAANTPVAVNLPADASLGGVTRITVFEELRDAQSGQARLVPRAERLVYRKPARDLRLSVRRDKPGYRPADRVGLEISATDEKGRPAAAILLVAVVNQSVIAMADRRADRLLPTHFLLASEVRHPSELEHADFLLTDHPKAAAALDLLLGNQGWRRFAEQNVAPPEPARRLEIERLLVATGGRTSAPVDHWRREEQRLAAEFLPKLELTGLRVVDAAAARVEYRQTVEPLVQQQVANLRLRVEGAEREHEAAVAELYHFETRIDQARTWALPALLIALITLVVGALVLAAQRHPARRRPYALSAVGALAAAALVFVAVIVTRGTPEAERAYAWSINQRSNQAGGSSSWTTVARPKVKDQGTEIRVPVRDMNPRVKNVKPVIAGVANLPRRAPWQENAADNARQKERIGRRAADSSRIQKLEELRTRPAGVAVGTPPPPPTAMPFVVREYAHDRSVSSAARTDFTDTVFWHPVLVVPNAGSTKVGFHLSDDVTRYRVLVAGHTLDGRVGAVTATIDATSPAMEGPK
jgi:hypothetical protein